MANLTITVDDEALKKARIRALEQGTSVNAILREFLEDYAGLHADREGALHDLLELSRSTRAARGDARWTREELHERA